LTNVPAGWIVQAGGQQVGHPCITGYLLIYGLLMNTVRAQIIHHRKIWLMN